jgi:carbon-monoxide dehydrogenase medium subunit
MYQTTYHRAASLNEAAAILGGAAEAKVLAGGQTLLPTMKQRLAAPSDLVDITRIAELAGIAIEGDALVIGAATPHYDVATSDTVAQTIPALARLAAGIGDPAVRYRGTIGGSVANNDPAADYPAAVLALGATLTTNRRTISADAFFRGLFETALGDGEILTSIAFPIPDKAGYAKFPHPASRFALTGVFVARSRAGAVRVAATGVGESGVFRVPAIEAALTANWSPEAAASVAVSPDGLFSDIHASADYRAHLVAVMAKRAVAAAG